MNHTQALVLAAQIAAEDALFADAHVVPVEGRAGSYDVEMNPRFDSPINADATYTRRVLVATPDDWPEWKVILLEQRDRTAGHRNNLHAAI